MSYYLDDDIVNFDDIDSDWEIEGLDEIILLLFNY